MCLYLKITENFMFPFSGLFLVYYYYFIPWRVFHCIIIIILSLLTSFSHQHRLMVFHWSLSNCKSLLVPSILVDLSNVEFWMVSTRPLSSNSFCHLTLAFGDHSKCTNYNWYHCHFHVS